MGERRRCADRDDVESRRGGRRRAPFDPARQVPESGPQHESLLAPVHRCGATEPRLAVADLLLVGVRGAGHLPQPQVVVVGLAGRVVAEDPQHVGLGLDQQRRHVGVGPDGRGLTDEAGDHVDPDAGLTERWGGAATAVDEEAVELVRQRLHPVDVRREHERGLRLTHREEPIRRETLQRIEGAGLSQRLGDLGVHVVREGVAGMVERRVARRIDVLDPLAGAARLGGRDGHRDGTALDADLLGRDPDPHLTAAQDLVRQVGVLGRSVDTAADVQPLDHDRAVEVRGLGRTAHHHPRLVRR